MADQGSSDELSNFLQSFGTEDTPIQQPAQIPESQEDLSPVDFPPAPEPVQQAFKTFLERKKVEQPDRVTVNSDPEYLLEVEDNKRVVEEGDINISRTYYSQLSGPNNTFSFNPIRDFDASFHNGELLYASLGSDDENSSSTIDYTPSEGGVRITKYYPSHDLYSKYLTIEYDEDGQLVQLQFELLDGYDKDSRSVNAFTLWGPGNPTMGKDVLRPYAEGGKFETTEQDDSIVVKRLEGEDASDSITIPRTMRREDLFSKLIHPSLLTVQGIQSAPSSVDIPWRGEDVFKKAGCNWDSSAVKKPS